MKNVPITLSDLKKTACWGLNKHLHEPEKKKKDKKFCKYKAWMEHRLQDFANENKIELSKEFHFAKPRQFRYDFCFVEQKISFEYNGIMSDKSRHTSILGYSKDLEKINLAQSLGWKVYQYTVINYLDLRVDLLNLKIK